MSREEEAALVTVFIGLLSPLAFMVGLWCLEFISDLNWTNYAGCFLVLLAIRGWFVDPS